MQDIENTSDRPSHATGFVEAFLAPVGHDVPAWRDSLRLALAGLPRGAPVVLVLPEPPDPVAAWARDVALAVTQLVKDGVRVIGVSGPDEAVAAVDLARWPNFPFAMGVAVLPGAGRDGASPGAGPGVDEVDEPGAADPLQGAFADPPFDGEARFEAAGERAPGFPRPTGIPSFEQDPGVPLKVIHRKVRSGEKIVNNGGDVHVHGPVGSGAEIHAAGSIVVFGEAAGRLFAGRLGDDRASVSCNVLRAEMVSVTGLFATGDRLTLVGRPVTVSVMEGKLFMRESPRMEPYDSADLPPQAA